MSGIDGGSCRSAVSATAVSAPAVSAPAGSTYLADDVFDARRRLTVFYDHCESSQVPELERLARTVGRWETPILRWHRTRMTNAATEGTNLIVKNVKRLGFGFRNFDNYRLRLLLRCAHLATTTRAAAPLVGSRTRVDRCSGLPSRSPLAYAPLR